MIDIENCFLETGTACQPERMDDSNREVLTSLDLTGSTDFAAETSSDGTAAREALVEALESQCESIRESRRDAERERGIQNCRLDVCPWAAHREAGILRQLIKHSSASCHAEF